VLAAAVDDERRGVRNSAGAGRVDIVGHPVGADMAAQILPEPVEVRQRSAPGEPAALILMLQQQVVHEPERALPVGHLGTQRLARSGT
jgi:hypothetical protein